MSKCFGQEEGCEEAPRWEQLATVSRVVSCQVKIQAVLVH